MSRRIRIGRKQIEVPESRLDRAINAISPAWGNKRLQHRIRTAMTGSYTGASKKRRQTKSWQTTGGDADADQIFDLPTLRERSRDHIRNTPLACGAVNTVVTNVVGSGLALNAEIDHEYLGLSEEQAAEWESQAERLWKLWAESKECDSSREQKFADIQDLAFRQTLENGDVFAVLPRFARNGGPFDLKVQLVEADRIYNKDNTDDTANHIAGIHKDPTTGAATKIDIARQHPGSALNLDKEKWDTVEIYGEKTGQPNVLHLKRILRPGQTRGVPYLAPVIEAFKQLDRYTEAELMAAVISGMFTVFIKTEAGEPGLGPMQPTSETGGSVDDDDYKMASGAIIDLGKDESIETANPGRPNTAFDPFVQAILRQIGVALELPFEVLIKHFTSSYTAARGALLSAWQFFGARRLWLAGDFCQPIYETFLYEQIVSGNLVAPGFLTDPLIRKAYTGAKWIGPTKGMLDEEKEIKAAEKRIDMTISTHQEETAALTGGDWSRKFPRAKREHKLISDAGMLPKNLQVQPAAPDANEDDKE